jgi:hypothetical protein
MAKAGMDVKVPWPGCEYPVTFGDILVTCRVCGGRVYARRALDHKNTMRCKVDASHRRADRAGFVYYEVEPRIYRMAGVPTMAVAVRKHKYRGGSRVGSTGTVTYVRAQDVETVQMVWAILANEGHERVTSRIVQHPRVRTALGGLEPGLAYDHLFARPSHHLAALLLKLA